MGRLLTDSLVVVVMILALAGLSYADPPTGQDYYNLAFWGIMRAFLVGTFIGIFIKLTNRS